MAKPPATRSAADSLPEELSLPALRKAAAACKGCRGLSRRPPVRREPAL